MDNVTLMIIIWAAIVAVAFLLEFLMYNFVSSWFAVGGLAALISAPLGLFWPWQIFIFFVVSFLFLLGMRPFVKRFIKTETVATNLDANVGMMVKLIKDCANGVAEIEIGDINWKVICPDGLKTGEEVEITGAKGNKYIVEKKEKQV